MSNQSTTLNTIQLFCRNTSEDAGQVKALENAGYALETVPTFSNKHVFHFSGRCNRSVGAVVTAGANPYDVFALLAETEIGNPFMIWEPERVKEIVTEFSGLKHRLYKGETLAGKDQERYNELSDQLQAQRKPIVFLGKKEEWEEFSGVLDHLADSGTARPGFKDGIIFEETAEEAVKVFNKCVPKNLQHLTRADYKFHTYDTGPEPVEVFVSQDYKPRPRITISFFGSATTRDQRHLETARKSVEMLYMKKWGLVNGGGSMGVMGAQLEKAKELGIYSHGISAHERGAVGLAGSEKDPQELQKLVTRYTDHKDMIHRIEHYLEESEGIGMLDGGIGSAQELFMVLELFRQDHKVTRYQDKTGVWHDKPLVVVDEHGTWSKMLEWAKKEFGETYMKPVKIARDMQEAQTLFEAVLDKYPPKLSEEMVEWQVKGAAKELHKIIPKVSAELPAVSTGRAKTVQEGRSIQSMVDLTNLKDPDVRTVNQLCNTAVEDECRSVCIPLNRLGTACKRLDQLKASTDHNVMATTVVNFPEGKEQLTKTVRDMREAVDKGADEIDTVIPKEMLKTGNYEECYDYLKQVIGSVNVPVKVILESAELTPDQIAKGALIAKAAGASFVKTSTGFSQDGGADVEAIEIMRCAVGDSVGVKASGGIKDFRQVMAMVEAGADVVGASGLTLTAHEQRVPARRMGGKLGKIIDHLPRYALCDTPAAAVGAY